MRADEYTSYDATGLAELIAAGEVSPRSVCEVAIAIIEAHNQRINAVVETCFDEALASIDTSPVGPLRGVPWLVKDFNTSVAGLHDTNGSRALRHVVAPTDRELLTRHRQAGLVVLGKTNTPEFGMNVCTNPSLFGPTHHPGGSDRSVGGSSGGSAAAVSVGMVPAAHATDSGGSIRIPASNCGLFGLKPSRNRVPLGNDASEGLGGLSTCHAVTNTVRDSALLLDLTHGPLRGDPYGPPGPLGRFRDAVNANPGRLRVGVITSGFAGEVVHSDCIAAAETAASLLEGMGHLVEPVEAPIDGDALRTALDVIFSTNIAMVAAALPATTSADDLEPATRGAIERAQTLSAADYARALHIARQIGAQLGVFFDDHDLLLTPTLAHPARPIGHHDPETAVWSDYLDRMLADIAFTPLFNVSGGPAASVPMSTCTDGFPVGVQLGAALGAEELLLSVARQIELERPWRVGG